MQWLQGYLKGEVERGNDWNFQQQHEMPYRTHWTKLLQLFGAECRVLYHLFNVTHNQAHKIGRNATGDYWCTCWALVRHGCVECHSFEKLLRQIPKWQQYHEFRLRSSIFGQWCLIYWEAQESVYYIITCWVHSIPGYSKWLWNCLHLSSITA